MARNALQAVETSLEEVAELVVCKKKGIQVDLGVGLKPSFPWKQILLWCLLI